MIRNHMLHIAVLTLLMAVAVATGASAKTLATDYGTECLPCNERADGL